MKVLFVQKVKALVGSEKYFLDLIPSLVKNGVEVSFACVYNEYDEEKVIPFLEAFEQVEAELFVLKLQKDSIIKSTRFLSKIIRDDQFDIIHSHLIHADLWCSLLKIRKRIKGPLVSTKHGYDESYIASHGFDGKNIWKNKYYKICKFSEKRIDRSFAVSKGLEKLFVESGISKASQIETIHHGFDYPEVEKTTSKAEHFTLITIGRIIPFKGHIKALEALVLLKDKIDDFKYLIVGHGDDELIKQLKKFVVKNDLKNYVDFTGYKSNIFDFLSMSDVKLVPSISEGFGLVFLEAMNAKLPIVGFDVAATNEIVVHNETGFLSPAYDIDQFANHILTLYIDKEKRLRMGEESYKRLKTYFSLERMTKETIAFYDKAL